MAPWSETANKQGSGGSLSSDILERFSFWVGLIQRYENLNFEDPIIESYESEIFNLIKLIDEDADFKPFNLEQQVSILKFLNEIQRLNSADNDAEFAKKITDQIDEAKVELTRLPKNQVMKRVSKILAYARKSSLSLFKTFWEVFVKEGMKKVLYAGSEKVLELLTTFNNLL